MFEAIKAIPTAQPATPLLDKVDGVDDLRALTKAQLPQLAYEIRLYLLYCIGQTGGHLGAGLGVVELTIVLHYLLKTPEDKIIWDVGHQAYPHKVLTGRKQQLLSIRQQEGVSAFPKRSESVFDCFGVGHASTSISALLGMVLMAQQQDDNAPHGTPCCVKHAPSHVAVIGDGALTGGMAYEALNHMAHTQADALVVLNDNDMSIGVNQGGVAKFLDTETALSGPKAWFTDLGFTYVGPIEGHHLPNLLTHVAALLALPGPKLLHLHTVKGKGYAPAEADPVAYHAIDKIEPAHAMTTAISQPATPQAISFAALFGEWACQQAATDKRLQVITPAMVGGSGLKALAQQYPKQLHDVAIAEQHAVTLAAGMACAGGKPVVAIYSTFLQRGYDQLIHDVALQNLDVLFAIDRAGVVGEDGATHTGAYDYGFLACVPNMVIMAPSHAADMSHMLHFGYAHKGPVAVRYPRANAHQQLPKVASKPIQLGKANVVVRRSGIAILNFGALIDTAMCVADALSATLVDMRFIKPLDTQCLTQLLDHDYWITIEDHAVIGGAGSLVSQWLAGQGNETINDYAKTEHKPSLLNLGLLDKVQGQGTRAQVLAANGLASDSVVHNIQNMIRANSSHV